MTPKQGLVAAGQSVQFTASGGSGSLVNLAWNVNGVVGGSSSTGNITSSGVYTAPSATPKNPVSITATNTISNEITSPAQVSFYSPGDGLLGTVSPSNNPLVALYSVTAPIGAKVQVQFGKSTSYGLSTGMVPAPASGGPVSVLVAGMRAGTVYHMQATTQLASGQQFVDADHTFTTGTIPASVIPPMTVNQPATALAAPGIELIDEIITNSTLLTAYATDLEGNIIWYYPLNSGETPFPIKPLPNGNMLLTIEGGSIEDGVREIDLAGNTVYQITRPDLNKALAAADIPFQLESLHHDVEKLANGHYMILGNYTQTISGQGVVGDALVEWDPAAQKAAWTWSAFDHLSLDHAPFGIADWTHANAVIYSPDDGNLVVSMRNQNFIIKINYQDGAGDGSILWRFGAGGDFTLPAGQDPVEWNFGQHYPTFVSPNSAGIFQMMFFNNGNGRLLDASNNVCGTAGFTACYSSVPLFQVNETTKSASLVSETILAPHFSICCGDAQTLSNGNVEYDVAADVMTPGQSFIQEVVPGPTPQLAWQMNIAVSLTYRGFRIPSLYPGVTWTQSAITAANASVASR